jgi:hypothetical protein
MVPPFVPACPATISNGTSAVGTSVKCPAIAATKSIATNSVAKRRVTSVERAPNAYASTTMPPFVSAPRGIWAMLTPKVVVSNVKRTANVRVADPHVPMASARIYATACVATMRSVNCTIRCPCAAARPVLLVIRS